MIDSLQLFREAKDYIDAQDKEKQLSKELNNKIENAYKVFEIDETKLDIAIDAIYSELELAEDQTLKSRDTLKKTVTLYELNYL